MHAAKYRGIMDLKRSQMFAQNVQLACRGLRTVLTRPRKGSYGVVKINPPDPADPLNSIQKYEDLSEWLRYRVQGPSPSPREMPIRHADSAMPLM